MKMNKMCMLLLVACMLFVGADFPTIIIEEHYDANGYRNIELKNGRYVENQGATSIKLEENLQTSSEVLRLPFIDTTATYAAPTEIEGIVEDIPFNYYSSLETSAEYVGGLLNSGFKITSYSATSRVILMELENLGVVYRVVIYDNYLKAYTPNKED